MAKKAHTTLSTLSFRTTTRPVKLATKQPRDVVLDFIIQQIALATAELEGRELAIEKVRYVKNDEGGSIKTRVASTPRRHFWQADGEWLIEVRYGNIIVELSPDHPSIAAGSALSDVVTTLEMVRTAILAGEADEAIATAAAKARRKAAA
jgi:hypothetical protein